MPVVLLALLSLFRLLNLTTGEGGDDPKPEKVKASDLLEQYGGNAVRMAEKLADVQNDNFTYRESNRALKTDNEALKKRVAPDGAIVLTGDDASRWQAYQQLGKTPDELTAALTAGEQAAQDLAVSRKAALVQQAAGLVGYDPDVLSERLGNLETEIRDVQQDGKTVKQPVVKDGTNVVPLTQYAEQHWPKYLPALKAAATTQQSSNVQFVPQTTSQAPASILDSAIQQLQEQRDARGPNPLKPT